MGKKEEAILGCVVVDRYPWRKAVDGDLQYCYAGSERSALSFVSFCKENPRASKEELSAELERLADHFGVIVSQGARTIAAVDKVRSYPLFYYYQPGAFLVSNSGSALQKAFRLTQADDLGLLEFRMAGYVTGKETVLCNLYQLQAGEFLIWDEEKESLERERYYLFFSNHERQEPEEELIQELDRITTRIFTRVAEEAKGFPIWVSLSGGLDSRLVLCKLKQLGYPNLNAFSYGPLFNHDAKWAKAVCEKMRVPWVYLPYKRGEIRKFFFSPLRREYWEFAGVFGSLPLMNDEFAVHLLKTRNIAVEGSCIINGNTGDFISGGHVHGYHMDRLADDAQYDADTVVRAIVKKHYSLNSALLVPVHLEKIRRKILDLTGLKEGRSYEHEEIRRIYECWEWQERQCKYVVNGQRSYDYFGYRWALPLWAEEYLRFWPEIPYELKLEQRLYKDYLNHFDFFGVFKGLKTPVWNWQGPYMAVFPIARVLRLAFGRETSSAFYRYMGYFGKYQHHCAPFGMKRWFAHASMYKNGIAFYIDQWLEESGFIKSVAGMGSGTKTREAA